MYAGQPDLICVSRGMRLKEYISIVFALAKLAHTQINEVANSKKDVSKNKKTCYFSFITVLLFKGYTSYLFVSQRDSFEHYIRATNGTPCGKWKGN